MFLRDICATAFSAGLAHAMVKGLEFLADQGRLSQFVCRKTVHITTGPAFVLTWPLFRLALVGSGVIKNEATIKAVSRGGQRQELLAGPLLYIAVVIAMTLQFWRHSPVGLLALCMMCVGDGLADIVGRRYGTTHLPYNTSKTWAGSLAMFAGGAVVSTAYVTLFSSMGYFAISKKSTVPVIWLTALLATIVEGLPIYSFVDDNFTVPLAAAVFGQLLMP